ncbi:MAG: Uma2 family endonuclease [Saprospirales bacterium]|nr:Uma2 family endonuclease [Saprospirales bacterium]
METVKVPITDISQLDPEGKYTYADYLLWKFKERVELIRGRLFKMTPAPNTVHQRISLELIRRVGNFFYKKPCQVFPAPFDVRLPKKGQPEIYTVVQPDLCVVCDAGKLDEKGCAGAPDLVVEILSPGNTHREMREKYEVYEEAGVKEYWLVNPWDKIVLIYILNEAGIFIGLQPLTEAQDLESRLFPGLKIPLKEVFEIPDLQ